MDRRGLQGILSLLLFALLLTLLTGGMTGHRFSMNVPIQTLLLQVLYVFLALFLVLHLIFGKQNRLRTLIFLLFGCLIGGFSAYLDIPGGLAATFLITLVLLLSRSLWNALREQRRVKRVLQRFNSATESYQRDHDAESYLAALDWCIQEIGSRALVIHPKYGTVLFQEYFNLEKAHVLGEAGRFEERQALLAKLRQQASKPDLLAALAQEETAFEILPGAKEDMRQEP